ncbi:hypothetical protein HYX02_00100 [Candidatus Woesearchaeota archaeon]|nr:hypothetical protein [Candidatus Woesearchaeota archaeon]
MTSQTTLNRRYTTDRLYDIVLAEAKNFLVLPDDVAKLCLQDEQRTKALMDIISETTLPDTLGADIGAGSGILGFAFLNAGGRYLFSVEKSPRWADFIRKLAYQLGFHEQMKVYTADATTVRLEPHPPIDYVIAELVSTGLSREPLVQAVKNIRQYASPNAIYLPLWVISEIVVHTGRRSGNGSKPLTKPKIYDVVHMPSVSATGVDCEVELEAINEGKPEHVALDTTLIGPNGLPIGKFDTLCGSFSVPLSFEDPSASLLVKMAGPFTTPKVSIGQRIIVRIDYQYGEVIDCEYGRPQKTFRWSCRKL